MNNIKIKLSVIANSIAIFALSILSIISFYFTKDSLYQSTLYTETELLKATQISIEDFRSRNISLLNTLEKDILKLSSNIQTVYQDRIDGNISLESYKMIVTPYEQKMRTLKDKLEEIELEILKRKNSANKIPNYTKKIKELLNIEKPNRDLLFTIIDRIEADEDRNITIKFKYKILEDYTFKYVGKNPIRNPYGRCGKIVDRK